VAVVDVTLAATARRLADELSRLSQVAAALADEAVWLASRTERARDVAAALGVSEPTVRKAIQQHNRRRKQLTEGTETDSMNSTSRASLT
jgi:prophage antirepressor-like protein